MALETDVVETFGHSRIADEPVDTTGLPLPDDFFRGEVPVVTRHEAGGGDSRLVSPGGNHGRSYEIALLSTENEPVVWQDQYGNVYTVLTTKGNNFSRAEMMRSATAPSGFIPYGLQEGDALLRVLRASRMMREAKIDTEWIVRVEEPKSLRYKDELLTPAEYKRRLITDVLARVALKGAEVEPPTGPTYTTEEAAQMAAALDNMDFFITLRATSTSDRVLDLHNAMTMSVDKKRLSKVFETYNRVAPYRKTDFEALGLPPEIAIPELDSKEYSEAAQRYFCEVLPKLLGLNLARMHNNGLSHVFPHHGNITALGGLVDLDSVRGTKLDLDDKPADLAAIAADFAYIIGDDDRYLHEMMNSLGFLLRTHGIKGDEQELMDCFGNNLIESYMRTRREESETPIPQREIIELLARIYEETDLTLSDEPLKVLIHPLVGEVVENEISELLKDTLTPSAHEISSFLYDWYIKAHVTNPELIAPLFDGSLPPLQEIKDILQGYLEGDDEHFAGKDVFEKAIYPYMECLRYEQIQSETDRIIELINKKLSTGPLAGIEEVNFFSLSVYFALLKDPIKRSSKNFELPKADDVWELVAMRFQLDYGQTISDSADE